MKFNVFVQPTYSSLPALSIQGHNYLFYFLIRVQTDFIHKFICLNAIFVHVLKSDLGSGKHFKKSNSNTTAYFKVSEIDVWSCRDTLLANKCSLLHSWDNRESRSDKITKCITTSCLLNRQLHIVGVHFACDFLSIQNKLNYVLYEHVCLIIFR